MTTENPTDSTASHDYVTHAAWLRTLGRADAIDEIADQFERRVAPKAESGAEAFWAPAAVTRWPTESRGWRPSRREVA